MKIVILLAVLFPFGAHANDFLGVPLGDVVDFIPSVVETKASNHFGVEGPFSGLFGIFDRYEAHVNIASRKLFRAESEKSYAEFDKCEKDRKKLWTKLTQKFGKPTKGQAGDWWFIVNDDYQKVSIDCRIYSESKKITLNLRAIDPGLAQTTVDEWYEKTMKLYEESTKKSLQQDANKAGAPE